MPDGVAGPRAHDRAMTPHPITVDTATDPVLARRLRRLPATQAPWPARVVGSEVVVPAWLSRTAATRRRA
jgi:hypothetical protein